MKSGDILTSTTRDAVMLVQEGFDGAWWVKDCEYNDETQDYAPIGKDYLLTAYEIKRDFEI